jgi:hypothetical protein
VCLLRKRFLGFGYAFARNDGKKFGWDLREKTPQSILWIDSSPFGGGRRNVVKIFLDNKSPVSAKGTATLFVKEG